MVEHGFVSILGFTTQDVHPPLYYLGLKLVALVFGDSPLALRGLSVVSAAALVAFGARWVSQVWNARAGWCFAALTLSSSGVLCFAQEARMYALAMLLVTGAVLCGQLALRDGQAKHFVALGVCTWAASLTHYFALIAVGFNALLLFIGAAQSARSRLRPLALAIGLAGLGFLPWVPFFAAQVLAVSRQFWIPPASFELVLLGLLAPFSYKYEDNPYPWQALVAVALIVGVIVWTLGSKRSRGARAEVRASLQILAVVGLTFGFSLLFSALVRPIYMPRYMIVCAGILLAVASAALARLPKAAAVAGTATLVMLNLPAWWRVQTLTFNGPFRTLGVAVRRVEGPPPVLVHNAYPYSFALFPSMHAAPQAQHMAPVPPGTEVDPTAGGLFALRNFEMVDNLQQLPTKQQLWLIDAEPGPPPTDTSNLSSHWKALGPSVSFEEPMSWVKLTVRRFEYRPAEAMAEQ